MQIVALQRSIQALVRPACLVAAVFFALCLDPVVLRAAGPVVTVTSMNPDSGVWMTPCCGMNACAQFVESTPFTISCPGGTPVRLEAPASVGETPFTEWRRPGSLPYTISPTFIVLPDTDVTLTVVYGNPVEPLPDFAVTGITLTPASPITGLTFSAQVTVTNQGAAVNTYDGWLDIWTDRAAAAGCRIYGTTGRGFGSLAPGAGRVLTFTGLTAGPAGAATFRAFAEVDCLIEEADETNNEATLAYTVRPRKTLSVSSVNPANAAIQVSPNDLVGQATGTAPFSRSYDPGAVVTLTAPADVGGYVFQKWRRDGLDFATTRSVEVTMEADHNLVAVYARPPSPDFWVSSITVMPTQPTAGYAFSASITVQNRGNAGGNGGSLAVWANKLFNSTCTRYESGMCLEYTPSCNWYEADQGLQVGTLAAGESRTFVFSGLGPLAQGSAYYLRAYVDAECETSEGVNGDLEGDNQSTRNYLVITGTVHTLYVDTLDGRDTQIAHSMDISGKTIGTTQFTRNFRDRSTVTLTAPPTTPDGGVFQKWLGLEPVVPTTPEVTFTMDTDKWVEAVYVGPGEPDFAVTGLALEPPGPPAGGTFSATVTITNVGTGRGVPGTLVLFPDRSVPANCWATTIYGPMHIYDLAAGASLTFTIPDIPAGARGAKSLLAFVDSFCATDEPDEANNQLFLPYEAVNQTPVADNDSLAVAEGGTLSPAAPGVLGNDTDAGSGALQAAKMSDPVHGTLTLNANGSFTYVHDGSETISDSFTYKVNDGAADSNVATVTITVIPVNDAPTDVTLGSSTVVEHQANGTAIGTLNSSDPDTGNTYVYTLVSGVGSTDNSSFRIDGDVLKTNAILNFKGKNPLSVRIRTTDQGFLSAERSFTISVTDLPEVKNDFDGDGRSDIGCYYPGGGNWYEFRSAEGFWQTQFGAAGTKPITGDFDGDGKTDFGTYAAALGSWRLTMSTDGLRETQFGYEGTIPVVGDFDGDGKDDIGCYFPAGGNWYVFKSTEGFWQTQFGYAGTIPVVGDFDGDGRDDIGCYYPPGGNWYVFQSKDGFWQTTFGYDGTIPIVGDFDADGKDDIGCYYPAGGNWYVFQSTKGFWQTAFGYAGTEPVVGDYDGDGKADLGCYYPTGGNWYLFKSTEGFWQTQFGYGGTIPLGGTLR